MHCLSTGIGGIAYSGTPSRQSQLCELDEVGSYSNLMVGLRYIRVSHSTPNYAHGMSDKGAAWSAMVGEATGGQSMSFPKVCPLTPELSSSKRSIIRSY